MTYLHRSTELLMEKVLKEFPAVVLTGPRQCGKTTLLRRCLGEAMQYVSIEALDIRAAAKADPRAFLDFYAPPVVLDEVQHAPELLPYIKDRIDNRRAVPGQYVLTGSQNLLLMESVTESLAGRAAILHLLPLSVREAEGQSNQPLPWERTDHARWHAAASPWPSIFRGSYPELIADPQRDYRLWQRSYVQTYLERDVRTVRNIADLTQFQRFLRALAHRNGQILNIADLSRDLGMAVNTVKAWISVMEASSQIIIVPPYFRNAGKQLVKRPKVYFTDTGVLCHLAGLDEPDGTAPVDLPGTLFETQVLLELYKTLLHRGETPRVYFWRTTTGTEVDFIVEHHGKFVPIEVKSGATVTPAMAKGIREFRKLYSKVVTDGYVVYTGEAIMPVTHGAVALPWACF